MRNKNFAIRFSNIKTSLITDDSEKGYTYNSSTQRGLIQWKLRTDTANAEFASGMLIEKWCRGFGSSIDLRRRGGVATRTGLVVVADNCSGLVDWLELNCICLTGSFVEVLELDSVTGVEIVLHTGVVGSYTPTNTELKININAVDKNKVSHLSRLEENGKIKPVVFGKNDKTKLINIKSVSGNLNWAGESVDELILKGGVSPYCQIKATNNTQDSRIDANAEGLEFIIKTSYDIPWDDFDRIATWVSVLNIMFRVVKGDAEGTQRKIAEIETLGTAGNPVNEMLITLSESDSGTATTGTDWKADTSFGYFYVSEYQNFADKWGNCAGWQDGDLYSYQDKQFLKIDNSGLLTKSENSVALNGNSVDDAGGFSGYHVSTFDAILAGIHATVAPGNIAGYPPSGVWNFQGLINGWTEFTPVNLVTAGSINNITDGDHLTSYFNSATYDGRFSHLQIFKLTKDNPISSDSFEVAIDMILTAKSVDFGSETWGNSKIKFVGHNSFGTVDLLEISMPSGSNSPGAHKVFNFYDGALENEAPITNLNKNRRWQLEKYGVNVDGDDWYTGHITLLADDDMLSVEPYDVYMCVWVESRDDVSTPLGVKIIEIDVRQVQLIELVDKIKMSDGVFAKWWGRNFDTTDFGSGEDDLIERSNDLLNHVCRLQNFNYRGFSRPANGWGLSYLSSYAGVINNATTYGGLQYYNPILPNIKMGCEIQQYSEVSTTSLKNKISQNGWLVSCVDRAGVENMFPISSFFYDNMDRLTIDLTALQVRMIEFIGRSSSDIFCQPEIEYDKNNETGKYNKKISISNIDASVYNYSYVKGVTSDSDASDLWALCKSLYNKYNIINTNPDELVKLPFVNTEADAINYLKIWLEWQGASQTTAHKMGIIKLKMPYEFAVDNDISIGTLVLFDLPMFNDRYDVMGVVASYQYQLDLKNPVCEVKFFVKFKLNQSQDAILQEDGFYVLQEDGYKILL